MDCHLPALFIGCNRPELSKLSLERLRDANPLYLFVDGPRPGDAGEHSAMLLLYEQVKRERAGKVTQVLAPDKNLGQRDGPWVAIRWFLKAEGMGCIIEDDILVAPEFLRAYSFSLRKHESNKSIFALSSSTTKTVLQSKVHPWVESNMLFVWGWATWWDRIENITIPHTLWANNRGAISQAFPRVVSRFYMQREFDMLANLPNYCWSYYLQQYAIVQGWRSLVPSAKMSYNTGISEQSLRTKKGSDKQPCREHVGIMMSNLSNPVMAYSRKTEVSIEKEKHGSFLHELRNRLQIGRTLRKICHRAF